MNRKRMVVAICLAVAVSVTSACGSGGKTGSSGHTYTITWATSAPADHPLSKQATTFMKLVEQNSNGRIKVKTSFNAALGAPQSLVSQVKSGVIQVTNLAPAYFSQYAPSMDVFSLPFLFSDLTDALARTSGDAGEVVAKELESKSGMTVLGWGTLGFTQLMTKSKRVSSPADMQGLKVRAQPSAINAQVVKNLGAVAVTLDSTEVLTGLQSGTITADLDPNGGAVQLKTYTVSKYETLLNLYYLPVVVAINTNFFDGLPSDLQKVVRDAAATSTQQEIQDDNALETANLKTITDSGIQVVDLTADERQAFVAVEQPVLADFAKTHGQSLVDSFTK